MAKQDTVVRKDATQIGEQLRPDLRMQELKRTHALEKQYEDVDRSLFGQADAPDAKEDSLRAKKGPGVWVDNLSTAVWEVRNAWTDHKDVTHTMWDCKGTP